MFHKTFKRAVYIGIGACAAMGVMRPPLTASAATTDDGDTAVSSQDADLNLDPSANTSQAVWQSQQAVAHYASWSAVFLAPPR